MPAGTHRTQRRAARGANRAAIVAAAETALRERPFRDVSVEDVMLAAGLARTQFYRHFDDLAGLVVAVSADVIGDLVAMHERLVDVAELDKAHLREALAPAVAAFAAHGPLVRAVTEAAVHDEAVHEANAAVQERYIALIARLLERAAVPDPEQSARYLHYADVAYLIDVFGGPPRATPEVALDTIVRHWGAVLSLGGKYR